MSQLTDYHEELDLLKEVAQEAGHIAMSYFRKKPDVWMKVGDSPVSEGDLAVNDFLMKKLKSVRPDYGWLSEETEDTGERLNKLRVFVVDPIDGTRAYIGGKDIWCVSIALIENGRPIAGVLECPALNETFLCAKNHGAKLNDRPLTQVAFNIHKPIAGPVMMNRCMEKLQLDNYTTYPEHIPSLAYRLAMVAKGDLCAAFARPRSHDWDIAAADLLLEEVGAKLYDVRSDRSDTLPIYNQHSLKHGVLLCASSSAPAELIEVAKSMAIHH